MQGSYNNFAYFSADFSASHAKLENIVANLISPEFAVKSHGDIEEFIQQEGTELLRTLLQGYFNMRAENEKHHITMHYNGAVLNHVRRNTSRKLISLFGSVEINRLEYSQRKKGSQFSLDKEGAIESVGF